MIDNIVSIVAPHHCCGCDRIGDLLCDNCKYDIISEQKVVCIVCGKPAVNGLCNECIVSYERAWLVGERDGVLQRLIGLYKFERAKAAYRSLGDLLLEVMPQLPSNTIIVPIPTTSSRIRERGYDHMLLIAKYIAKKRNLRCSQLIERKNNTKQRHASAKKRQQQAANAFMLVGKVNKDVPYLIIDDVMTTGSTIKFATELLNKNGAKHVWVAVIARQALS